MRTIEEEMSSSYLDYAMSVIVGRALPDVRDGLKPVHRRVLYVMNELGLQPNRRYVKSAQIVGEVMGKYHPHGDSAIYDTLVRLAQDFSMRHPLVDGQGNFGNVDGYSAAAMRYTEARLDRLATELMRDLDADTVDFSPTYDSSRQEPVVLPSRFPNLLVNGAAGIAVGMATNIPPHNLGEVVSAVIATIDNPEITVEGLMEHIKGPDFPTAGTIYGLTGIRDAYETGRGRVRIRARAGVEPIGQGREAIIVTELPYQVRKGGDGGLIVKIAELVGEKKIPEISDVRDESDRHGMRLVIELKRDANPKVVLSKLYKHTAMQTTFGVNMVALVNNVPKTLSLKQVIGHYIDHQREIIVRRTKFELRQKEARVHILEGLLIALDRLDEVIELIRASRDPELAREGLIKEFELSRVQAQAILDLRLQRLTALESDKIRQEHSDLLERIKELREILGDEKQVLALIKEELAEISETYGDERRTDINPSEDDVDIEDLIKNQQMVVAITNSGYVKTVPLDTYKKQGRGGVGVTGMGTKEGDWLEHLVVCSSHDYLLFFTNRGRVYRTKVYELPEGARTGKGRAIVNVLELEEGETVKSLLSTRDFGLGKDSTEGKYLVFATKRGMIKKTELAEYNTQLKTKGIIAIKIREDDELVAVRNTTGDNELIMVSRSGQAVRFSESQTRPMGRGTSGVRGMNVDQEGNAVLAMDVADPTRELLVVTENGFGKRTPIDQYRETKRGAMGVRTIKLSDARGGLAGALVVKEHQELVFVSTGGKLQRTGVKGISKQGRSTQGVRVMNVKDDDTVAAVALIAEAGVRDVSVQDELSAQPASEDAAAGNDSTDVETVTPVDESPADGDS
ncbi:MAG: DNA gyrase subunit A [Actinomycetes bacterium]